MKNYSKGKNTVNYHDFNKFQPCFTCKKACGKCNWSRDAKPVDGWKAIPTYIPENERCKDSFKILYCPEYENDR